MSRSHSPRPSVLSVVFFLLLISDGSSRTLLNLFRETLQTLTLPRLSSRLSSRTGTWTSSRLFVNRRQLRQMREKRVMDEVFVVEKTRVAFPFNGTCEMPARMQGQEAMPQCYDLSGAARALNAENWQGTDQGCCKTVMSVELPQIVTSVLTGQRHRVLQFFSTSQLVHTGACQKEEAMCVLGGRCRTVMRIQWLLVRTSPIPAPLSADLGSVTETLDDDVDDDDVIDDDDSGSTAFQSRNIFVPTMVNNHCQCVFS